MDDEYEKLIDLEKRQVFVFSCPANIPLNFARHLWFVCNDRGRILRWEILFRKNKEESWGYLYRDQYPLFSGIKMFPLIRKWHWEGELVAEINGEVAGKIIETIEASRERYPYLKKYSIVGPNSNSYVRWVLGQFPEINIKLPWNAFGK